MKNRVCEWEINLNCANAKPRDVVHSAISMSSQSQGSTMLASLASSMSMERFPWFLRRFLAGGCLLDTGHLLEGSV